MLTLKRVEIVFFYACVLENVSEDLRSTFRGFVHSSSFFLSFAYFALAYRSCRLLQIEIYWTFFNANLLTDVVKWYRWHMVDSFLTKKGPFWPNRKAKFIWQGWCSNQWRSHFGRGLREESTGKTTKVESNCSVYAAWKRPEERKLTGQPESTRCN